MYHGFSLSGMRLGGATADDARSGGGGLALSPH